MATVSHDQAAILIIDSDPIELTGIAAVLNMAGYECTCARDRVAAEKAVKTLALDLIICDVHLRTESGLDLCRDLRMIAGAEDVPVMFMSSTQAADIVRKSHDAGGAYYLRKPFDPEVLVELVGKALWMPHLVQSKVNRMHSAMPGVPSSPKVRGLESIMNLRIPQA